MLELILGGARSGKSRAAAARITSLPQPWIYLATCEPRDDEMIARIARHREMRGTGWQTVEESRDLGAALAATDGQGVRLVDCLTLWLSNSFRDDDFAAETGPASICPDRRALRRAVSSSITRMTTRSYG